MSSKPASPASSGRHPETVLTHTGRVPDEQFGYVNTPVYRATTVLYPDIETFRTQGQRYGYALGGTPTQESVETVLTELEGGYGTKLVPSGLTAITCALQAMVSAGDEILVTDSVYEPGRRFCEGMLKRAGVATRYFDPRIGAGIAGLITEKTSVIMLESPGSLTFEIQDVPAIAEAARKAGHRDICIIIDNTWATPLFSNPLKLGANVVVHAGTKMFGGHSDVLIGTMTADKEHFDALAEAHAAMGLYCAPDDCFLAARSLRSLNVRMQAHRDRSLEMAAWLESHPLVERVIHPALPSHPDHALFKRDFRGSGSIFSFGLPKGKPEAVSAMFDHFDLFGIGVSWGGFESLILPIEMRADRKELPWPVEGQLVRVHVGMENFDELKADLAAGLARYQAAM